MGETAGEQRGASVPGEPAPATELLGVLSHDAFDHDALALAERSAGIGVWSIDLTSGLLRATAQFFRITYVLLFVLGSVLFCQGATHMLRSTSLFDLALNNPTRITTSLTKSFSQSVAL